MGLYTVKPSFQKVLGPVESICIDHKISPDSLNLAALVVSIAIAGVFYVSLQIRAAYICIPFLVFFRLMFNALDGMVARKTGCASRIGEVHNELSDRLSDLITIFAVGFSGNGNGILAGVTCSVMLLSSYIGIVSKSAGGPRIYKGIMCKPDRLFLLGAAAIAALWLPRHLVWDIYLLTVLAGVFITGIQRYVYIRREFVK
jgi:CDP-diacylglycerol---glycerol-3-phosphate 3-phosphatidyltransferase